MFNIVYDYLLDRIINAKVNIYDVVPNQVATPVNNNFAVPVYRTVNFRTDQIANGAVNFLVNSRYQIHLNLVSSVFMITVNVRIYYKIFVLPNVGAQRPSSQYIVSYDRNTKNYELLDFIQSGSTEVISMTQKQIQQDKNINKIYSWIINKYYKQMPTKPTIASIQKSYPYYLFRIRTPTAGFVVYNTLCSYNNTISEFSPSKNLGFNPVDQNQGMQPSQPIQGQQFPGPQQPVQQPVQGQYPGQQQPQQPVQGQQ